VLKIVLKKQFKKDVKKLKKQGKKISELKKIIELLAENKLIPRKYLNHPLKGHFSDCMGCHIEPNWLLIYSKRKNEIIFIRTGSHSELFN